MAIRNRWGEAYTSACGKRTLAPYTMPFRTPFTSVRMSWYLGSRMIFSSADCSKSVHAAHSSPCAFLPRARVTCPCLVLRDRLDSTVPRYKQMTRSRSCWILPLPWEQRSRVKRREMGENGGRVKTGTLDRVASWSETAGYGAGCARPAVWPRLFASHYRRRLPHIRCPRSR